jgi:hypothetical protein
LADAEDFGAGGFFADEDALADALATGGGVGSTDGVGVGVGAGVGVSTGFGAQTSPPEGPTAVGVGGDGRGELPHAANAAKETTSATSRAREASERCRARMARMVARSEAVHNRIRPHRSREIEGASDRRSHRDGREEALRVEVVFPRFVDDAKQSESVGLAIFEHGVDLPSFERCEVSVVGDADDLTLTTPTRGSA